MTKRRKVAVGVVALGICLLCVVGFWRATKVNDGTMEVRFLGYSTNAAGMKECVFTFQNDAWDCFIAPRVAVGANARRAMEVKKRFDDQGNRIWPRMSFTNHSSLVASDVGSTIPSGRKATLRFAEPETGPWMLHVSCVRTNTSRIAYAVADLNKAANARLRIPVWFRVEQTRVVTSEIRAPD